MIITTSKQLYAYPVADRNLLTHFKNIHYVVKKVAMEYGDICSLSLDKGSHSCYLLKSTCGFNFFGQNYTAITIMPCL